MQHFTTMTCWHFISTHFLRASIALIFLVLTSPLRCRSSMVKRTRLERSVITVRDKDGCRPRAACTRDAVSAAETTGSQVTPEIFSLTTHTLLFLLISSCVAHFELYLCMFSSSPPSQNHRVWSGPPLSVFDKLNLTLCISECQFVKYPKWGVTCRLLQPPLCRLRSQLLCLKGDVLHKLQVQKPTADGID